MLYADKQHLKTEVAVDLLRVREKEMNFYSSNLSTVGTQSALLAGFAFAILAQKEFTLGAGGFWPRAWRDKLGLRPLSAEDAGNLGWTAEELEQGVLGWHWDTAIQQVFQFFHLTLTSIGMTIQLWTLYTCVLTNILGLSLALRGPEGSVDRAVRHMAEQNQLVMNRFGMGVIIFFVSIMLFSLMEYEIYVSIPVCACVTVVFRMMMRNIRSLVNEFWLDQDTEVTGQFMPGDKRREAKAAAKVRAQASARLRGESIERERRGLQDVATLLTGRYEQEDHAHQLPRATMRDRVDALRWRTKYLVGLATKDESRRGRAAQVSKWAHQNSRDYRQRQVAMEEMQAPTTVVDKLIRMTQSPSAVRRARDAQLARRSANPDHHPNPNPDY
jgi:hypothetical protein